MTVHNINFPIIDLTTSQYGKRACFGNNTVKVNPRNELGKIGISTHSWFSSLFHQTIKIRDQKTNKIVYFNKKSAVKWIKAVAGEDCGVTDRTKNEQIVDKIQQLLTAPPAENKSIQVNKQTLSKVNALKGRHWQGYFNYSKENWLRFKARFFLAKHSEKTLKEASETAAVAQYFLAKARVPAYQKFLSENQKSHRFSQIPITSKDNYIKKANHNLDLYIDRNIPDGSKNDTSTGTTNLPTHWFRGPVEQDTVEQLSSYAAKAILGDKPYYFINGFALGQWASGTTALAATRNDKTATIANPGMDVKKIFEAIKLAIDNKPFGYPIVVAGYPPHLREVVDMAIKENFDLSKHNIIGVVGGEGMSEGQRDLIVQQRDENGTLTRQGFSRCYSTYGASDLDVNLGYESDFEVELRKLCHTNPQLAAELFDDKGSIPMIFHYDPLNYHIETNEEQHLIFTCTRNDRISPRVRYDLGDKGNVMANSDLLAILKKHGVTLKNMPRTNLPFVFVWGRGDSIVSYRGAIVAPENLGEAINRAGLNEKIAHYALFQYTENGKTFTEFMVEPKEGHDLPPNLLETLVDHMRDINPDFKKQFDECADPDGKPKLRLFEPGTSPMSAQRERYPQAKKKYIFFEKAGDEFTPDHKILKGTIIN